MTDRLHDRLAALAVGDLPPAEADALRAAHPLAAAHYDAVLAGLHAEGARPVAVPAGLAEATVARLVSAAPPESVWPATGLRLGHWPNLFSLAASLLIGLTVAGFCLTAVVKVRRESQWAACRNQLRELHLALDGYAGVHAERYPQVGTGTLPVAGELAGELGRAGQPSGVARCPTGGSYAYTLGVRPPGGVLLGVRRGDGDLTPLAADAGTDHPAGRRHVLLAGGSLRATATSWLPPNPDDLFVNELGVPRAGRHAGDVCLGGPADYP